jgi:hypothetical protein
MNLLLMFHFKLIFFSYLFSRSPPTLFVHRRRDRQQRLNDVDVDDVKRTSLSFGDAKGGGTINSTRQYVKDLSDSLRTRIVSDEHNRLRQQQQQGQETVPRRQKEHRQTDGWQNEAFAAGDPSLEKHQTTRF